MVRLGALVTAAALCMGSAVANAASVNVGTVTGAPNQTVTFSVTLGTDGANVNGAQNDVAFDSTNTPIPPAGMGNCSVSTGTPCTTNTECPNVTLGTQPPANEQCVNLNGPDCDVNPAIGKGGFFAFTPKDCTGASCTGIRAIIVALNNTTTAIADGSTLYSCKVNIPVGTPETNYPLTTSNAAVSDTALAPICGTGGANPTPACGGSDGHVTVSTVVATPFWVCDVNSPTGDNAGQFGSNSLNIADVKAIFRAAQHLDAPPPAGSDRFSAMDSITADNPPTCGGSGTLNIADVKACFRRAQHLDSTNFLRTRDGSNCTSAVKP